MRLILTDDDGTVIDSEEITVQEWDNLTPIGAYAILTGMRGTLGKSDEEG